VSTGRQRASPRTKKHREHTRNVDYTIEIVVSNLSKVE
jgi:hypothetical protein